MPKLSGFSQKTKKKGIVGLCYTLVAALTAICIIKCPPYIKKKHSENAAKTVMAQIEKDYGKANDLYNDFIKKKTFMPKESTNVAIELAVAKGDPKIIDEAINAGKLEIAEKYLDRISQKRGWSKNGVSLRDSYEALTYLQDSDFLTKVYSLETSKRFRLIEAYLKVHPDKDKEVILNNFWLANYDTLKNYIENKVEFEKARALNGAIFGFLFQHKEDFKPEIKDPAFNNLEKKAQEYIDFYYIKKNNSLSRTEPITRETPTGTKVKVINPNNEAVYDDLDGKGYKAERNIIYPKGSIGTIDKNDCYLSNDLGIIVKFGNANGKKWKKNWDVIRVHGGDKARYNASELGILPEIEKDLQSFMHSLIRWNKYVSTGKWPYTLLSIDNKLENTQPKFKVAFYYEPEPFS